MKNSILALRSLFKRGQNNNIKILSLGVGLAMGLVLIAKYILYTVMIAFIRTTIAFTNCRKKYH